MSGQPNRQAGIVDEHGADPDHDRIGLGAHGLDDLEGRHAGDDHALALAAADHPVGGDRELQRHMRAPSA